MYVFISAVVLYFLIARLRSSLMSLVAAEPKTTTIAPIIKILSEESRSENGLRVKNKPIREAAAASQLSSDFICRSMSDCTAVQHKCDSIDGMLAGLRSW